MVWVKPGPLRQVWRKDAKFRKELRELKAVMKAGCVKTPC